MVANRRFNSLAHPKAPLPMYLENWKLLKSFIVKIAQGTEHRQIKHEKSTNDEH